MDKKIEQFKCSTVVNFAQPQTNLAMKGLNKARLTTSSCAYLDVSERSQLMLIDLPTSRNTLMQQESCLVDIIVLS